MHEEFRKDLRHLTWEEIFARQVQRAHLVDAWLDALQLGPGQRIADVGAGPGFVSLAAAGRVGPTGLVYAIDRSAEALAFLANLQQAQGSTQIETIVADAATLPPDRLRADAALITLVLHHTDDPQGLLRRVAAVIAPGGRVVVAEFHPDGPGEAGPPREHRIAPERLRSWANTAGFRLVAERRQTPEHYMQLWEVPAVSGSAASSSRSLSSQP